MSRVHYLLLFAFFSFSVMGEPHDNKEAAPDEARATVLPDETEALAAVAKVKEQVGPYTAYADCSVYTNQFHFMARGRDWDVRSIGADCKNRDFGHYFNAVRMKGGEWHFIDPQVDKVVSPGFDKLESFSAKALCEIMQTPLDKDGQCPCEVTETLTTPVKLGTNPVTSCALNPDFLKKGKSPGLATYRRCEACCGAANIYHLKNRNPLYQKWGQDCRASCRSHFYPQKSDAGNITSPRANDSFAVASGRVCVSRTSRWSASSRFEQCRGCCLDRARKGFFELTNNRSCLAVCRAEYGSNQ